MYDGYADLYRACAQGFQMSPEQVDATEVWKIGAILKPAAATVEDDAAVEEYVAWREGRGPEPAVREVPMSNVLELATFAKSRVPD